MGALWVNLPNTGYMISSKNEKNQEYAANPVAHDQKRWDMYSIIALYVSRRSAFADVEALLQSARRT